MSTNLTIISLLFCAFFVVTLGQVLNTTQTPTTRNPNQRPLPTPDAQVCIAQLSAAGVLDKCHNDSLAKWNPQKRGESAESLLDFCCSAYGEIDCIRNATWNGKQCPQPQQKQAMKNHQDSLFLWLRSQSCKTIRYHDGMCDPDRVNNWPPPMPKLVNSCNLKLYNQVNHCKERSLLDWKVLPTDGPSSQSVCCSRYQTNDCLVSQAKKMCTQNESIAFNQYYHYINMNISKVNCSDNQYQSFNCFKANISSFPPPEPPLALNCLGKISGQFVVCSNKIGYIWNTTLSKDQTSRNSCCSNWDMFDCLTTAAKDTCTLAELSEFEQYYNFLSQMITKVNCTRFPYHSPSCKGPKPNPAMTASDCLKKINVNFCQNLTKNIKWKVKGVNATNQQSINACCSQLSLNMCMSTTAMEKCNVTELTAFELYLTDRMTYRCGQNQLSLKQCSMSAASVLNSRWLNSTILLILLLLFLRY